MERLKAHTSELESLETMDDFAAYIYDNILFLRNPEQYRAKIKGFHMAFNVKEKLVYDNEFVDGN